MPKKAFLILLSLMLVTSAFAKSGPVAFNPEDVSSGFTAPNNWNIQTDQVAWTAIANAPDLFGRAATGVLGNYMYCFGEQNNNLARALNLTTELWEFPTVPLYGNCNWCGVTTDQHFYIVGRYYGAYGTEFQRFTPTAGGPTGTWDLMAAYPHAVCGVAADWDGGNFIYAAGGGSPDITNAYKYDITNNTWTAIANLPVMMKYHGGSFVSGKFHVVGGYNTANAHYAYDPATNTWATLAAVPVAIYFSTFSITGNGVKLFSIGGGGGYGTWPATNAVQIYDPGTDTWSQETTLPMANGLNSAAYAGGGISYSAGGYTGVFHNEAFKGTGFPEPYNPNAPAAPSNFTATPQAGGSLVVDFAWTNPSLTFGGATLTELSNMYLDANGANLNTYTNPTIGGNVTDTYTMAAAGMYNYEVYGDNSSGRGPGARGSEWIGLDVPGEPSNVTATPDPGGALTCDLAWTAPTAGAHGGYWPAGSWSGQRVYRDGSMVADLTGTNTSYTDNVIVQGWYSYGASYYNASGEGSVVGASPDPVFVGPPEMQSIPYDWVEINTIGTNTGITGDDQNLGPFPMGFDYPWYDAMTYNSIRVCSNGFLSFTSTSTAWTNAAIPNTLEPNNLVAPWWEDLYPPGGGAIWYHYDGVNGRFIVEFDHVAPYSGTGTATFEAIFYRTGIIDFMYMDLGWTGSATVGIENGAGTVGIQCTYNGSGPLEPTSLSGIRIFPPFYAPLPDVMVTVYPYHAPARAYPGGLFWYIGVLENTTTSPQTFDLWAEVILPGGTRYGPVMQLNNLTLPGGAILSRGVRVGIPNSALPGDYQYYAAVGDYPNVITCEDQFPFTILNAPPVGSNNEWFSEWGAELSMPAEYTLNSAYPNPFNPATTISFTLPEAAKVNLVVYDVNGREVATLVNGMMSAGVHETEFSGENLASGIYFYKLTAGDFSSVKKMMLVK